MTSNSEFLSFSMQAVGPVLYLVWQKMLWYRTSLGKIRENLVRCTYVDSSTLLLAGRPNCVKSSIHVVICTFGQFTAQRHQKAANTSLLESRNLLQTATLVLPRPIVCSRLSNNINILAKKIFRPPKGGGHGPPGPRWIRH